MRVLAVCGMGLGSSLVLRIGVEAALRELGIEGTVEAVDVSTAKADRPDLIVTSGQLAELLHGRGVPVIEIHNYVDRAEIKSKLQAALSR